MVNSCFFFELTNSCTKLQLQSSNFWTLLFLVFLHIIVQSIVKLGDKEQIGVKKYLALMNNEKSNDFFWAGICKKSAKKGTII